MNLWPIPPHALHLSLDCFCGFVELLEELWGPELDVAAATLIDEFSLDRLRFPLPFFFDDFSFGFSLGLLASAAAGSASSPRVACCVVKAERVVFGLARFTTLPSCTRSQWYLSAALIEATVYLSASCSMIRVSTVSK